MDAVMISTVATRMSAELGVEIVGVPSPLRSGNVALITKSVK